MSNIADEVVRLIGEISRDEVELRDERAREASYTSEIFRKEHTIKAKLLEEALERKIRLLEILTRV